MCLCVGEKERMFVWGGGDGEVCVCGCVVVHKISLTQNPQEKSSIVRE